MSQFLHQRVHLNRGQFAVLNSDTQCNFMLLDDINFNNYRNARSHNYFGGFYKFFPAQIAAPHTDYWNVIIDLGGGSANIEYSLTYR